jgi:GNAT superfamily N-acetyltransferase
MTDLVIKHLAKGEEHLFRQLPDSEEVGRTAFGRPPWRSRDEGGEYRLDWSWIAQRDGVVVARAAWWGGPDDHKPIALDHLDFAAGEQEAAARLIQTAPFDASYELFLPPRWRERPGPRQAGQGRIDVAKAAGMKPLVERFSYVWRPSDGLPARPGRLEFRPEPDDEAVYRALLRIERGTLDAHARKDLDEGGIEKAAQSELDFFRWCPSPREWWQLAYTRDGEPAGLHIPARNQYDPVIGFIGVVPEQRGHGYAYDLLAECTHVLAEHGADRIHAATDFGNAPMAATFAKAGYPVEHVRYCMAR